LKSAQRCPTASGRGLMESRVRLKVTEGLEVGDPSTVARLLREGWEEVTTLNEMHDNMEARARHSSTSPEALAASLSTTAVPVLVANATLQKGQELSDEHEMKSTNSPAVTVDGPLTTRHVRQMIELGYVNDEIMEARLADVRNILANKDRIDELRKQLEGLRRKQDKTEDFSMVKSIRAVEDELMELMGHGN